MSRPEICMTDAELEAGVNEFTQDRLVGGEQKGLMTWGDYVSTTAQLKEAQARMEELIQDRQEEVDYEYAERVKAEQRIAALEDALGRSEGRVSVLETALRLSRG